MLSQNGMFLSNSQAFISSFKLDVGSLSVWMLWYEVLLMTRMEFGGKFGISIVFNQQA
jgi:hypothetical protein